MPARVGHASPGAAAHPEVDEALGSAGWIAGVESGSRARNGAANAVRFIRRWGFGIDESEENRLVQREPAYSTWLRERGDQRHRGAIGVSDQYMRIACARQHGLEQVDFVAKGQRTIGRPRRTLAGTERVGGQDVEPAGERLHERAPLHRGARVCVEADDSTPGAGLAKEGTKRRHRRKPRRRAVPETFAAPRNPTLGKAGWLFIGLPSVAQFRSPISPFSGKRRIEQVNEAARNDPALAQGFRQC